MSYRKQYIPFKDSLQPLMMACRNQNGLSLDCEKHRINLLKSQAPEDIFRRLFFHVQADFTDNQIR